MQPREGDPANAEHAKSDDYSCTDSYVHWKGHDEVGKVESSAHIRCRWQNILTKLPEVMGQARKATTPFERRNCLITDEISDNIVQHTNLYILLSTLTSVGACGGVVVKALYYKPAGRGFDSRLYHWNFSVT